MEGDWINPFGQLGDITKNIVADGWTGIMLTSWDGGMWVLTWVLNVMDRFLTPDISTGGPAGEVYQTTFWIAGAVLTVMALIQLGVAAIRRDGTSFARVLIGTGQFIIVWAAWITYGVALLAACSGLTRALLKTLLGVDAWANWDPLDGYDWGQDDMTATYATILGVLGLFLWMAAIGHFIIMLTRGAALLVLAAVTPIAAAGLVADAGRSWFWKSLRWFHAAALTPVLTALVTGIGTKLAGSVAEGKAATVEEAIGTAFPATMLILVSVVAPAALFRLLAFVDPGTSSGAALRAGVTASGGVSGLMSGGGSSSSTASSSTTGGHSQGEAQSNAATSGRVGGAMAGLGTAAGGFVGGAAAAYGFGMQAVGKLGAQAASVGIDEMNQTSVGDNSYFPDYYDRSNSSRPRFNPDQRDPQAGGQPNGGAGHTPGSPKTSPAPAGGGGAAGAAAGEVPPVV